MRNIIFFGYNNWGADTLDYLLSKGYSVVSVIVYSNKGEKYHKIREVTQKYKCNIPIYSVEEIGWLKIKHNISKLKSIIGLSCSFGAIIPDYIFSIPQMGVVNLHGGKLPEMRGSNELQWALINNYDYLWVTLHQVEKDLDTGPIFCEKKYTISEYDDSNTLKKKMFKYSRILLEENLSNILYSKLQPVKQDHSIAYYFPKRMPKDSKINWKTNAKDIINLVRALPYPYPGAFFYFQENKYEIEECEIIITNKPYKSVGKVVSINDNKIEILTLYNKVKITKLRDCSIKNLNIMKGDYLE